MAHGGYQGALAVSGTPMLASGVMGEVWLTPLRSGYRERKGCRAARADMWLINPSLWRRSKDDDDDDDDDSNNNAKLQ